MATTGKRTTIQIDGETQRLLEHLKRSEGASSYAQVIRSLIRKTKRLTKSTMGSLPELPPFRREKRDRFD
ncbi:MAG TPA: hypothetical protein VJ300_02585 [Thermoplasmata archaeon]|nr:hypothetical protein [Thermoplasmata archaeon]